MISEQLSEQDITDINDAIGVIKSKMPWLIGLTPTDRKTLPKIDDVRFPFVEKALFYGYQHSDIIPPYVDIPELQKDLELYKNLDSIWREIRQLNEMLGDTRIAAGSDAFVTALQVYNTAKAASKAKVAGTDAIVADLSKLFEGQGKVKTEEQDVNNNEE